MLGDGIESKKEDLSKALVIYEKPLSSSPLVSLMMTFYNRCKNRYLTIFDDCFDDPFCPCHLENWITDPVLKRRIKYGY